jgi:NAD(P)-dependent dehydrogenase (short-subunit alcohol dehydrogenase family)
MRLEGKVALITGAASGMGASMARIFAREGAKVVVADQLDDEGRKIVAGITQANGAASFHHLDVTDEANWRSVVAAAISDFGKLDILVNNAGISGSAVEDLYDTDAWDKIMDVNARGAFFGMKHAIPEMRKIGGGSIVNISSISGVRHRSARHPRRLQRLEGRSADDDQGRRGAARAAQYKGKFGASGADAADAHLGTYRRPGNPRQDARAGAARPRRPGRRGGACRVVSRLG